MIEPFIVIHNFSTSLQILTLLKQTIKRVISLHDNLYFCSQRFFSFINIIDSVISENVDLSLFRNPSPNYKICICIVFVCLTADFVFSYDKKWKA
jgi:hypothetical protein